MFKSLLLSFIALFVCIRVEASTQMPQHEDFVHFTEKEKEAYIIKMMELVVALEEQYQLETATYGYSQERFEKFQKVVHEIRSAFFIGSAYAAGPSTRSAGAAKQTPAAQASFIQRFKDWDALANDFKKNNKQNRCIFAGWISTVKSGSVCSHPNFMEDKPGKASASCGGNDPKTKKNFVQCNPVIFGYKNLQEKSLFCVSTSNRAESSSFHCMQLALGIKKEEGADDPKTRLDYLKSKYENPENFQKIFGFNYKTCVCSSTPEGFNRNYQDYMRPGENEKESDRYRTCYGLMNMMNEVRKVCEPQNFNNSIFEQFESLVASAGPSSGKDADDFYKNFIRNKVKNEAKSAEAYKQLCEQGSLTTDNKPQQQDNGGGQQTGGGNNGDSGDDKGGYVCTAICTKPKGQAQTQTQGAGTQPAQAQTSSDTQGTPKPGQQGSRPLPAPAATAASSGITCTYNVHKKDKPDEKLEGAKPEGDKTPAENVQSILVKHEKLPQSGLECKITWKDEEPESQPDATNGEKPSLKVTANKGDTHYDLKAETSNDQGWTFGWELRGAEKLKVEKDWEKKPATSSTPAGMATDDSISTPSNPGTSKSIRQKRLEADYNVCAFLKKGDEKIEECTKIEKVSKATPAAVPQNFNQNMPQPQMIRRASDISTMGVR